MPMVRRSTMVSAWSRVPAIGSGVRGEDGDGVARVREEQASAPAKDHVAERCRIGLLAQYRRAHDARGLAVDDQEIAGPGPDDLGGRTVEEPVARPIHQRD